jgi:hypothetical protein
MIISHLCVENAIFSFGYVYGITFIYVSLQNELVLFLTVKQFAEYNFMLLKFAEFY